MTDSGMTDISPGLFYEDVEIGQMLRSPRSLHVDRDRLIAFATEFDPQPAHLSEEAAAASQFGTLVASGWHTGSMTMRLTAETLVIANGGMGAGVEKLNWLRPVKPGDSLRIELTFIAKRLSRSRPERGLVTCHTVTFNQHNEAVYEVTANVFMPRRPQA